MYAVCSWYNIIFRFIYIYTHALGASLIIPTLGHPVPAAVGLCAQRDSTRSIIETFSLLNRKRHYSENERAERDGRRAGEYGWVSAVGRYAWRHRNTVEGISHINIRVHIIIIYYVILWG